MKKFTALLLIATVLPLGACEYRGYYGDGHDWHHGDTYDNSYRHHHDDGDRDDDDYRSDRDNYRR